MLKPEKLLALQDELAELQRHMITGYPPEQESRMIRPPRQQDVGSKVKAESPISITTHKQSSPAYNHDVGSPAMVQATAISPANTKVHVSPSPSTHKGISPVYSVDKYQAWQSYLTGYLKTQAVSKDTPLLLKIMEMKGSFEAEWDRTAAVIEQESRADGVEVP